MSTRQRLVRTLGCRWPQQGLTPAVSGHCGSPAWHGHACVCVYMWVCLGGPLVLPPSCASCGAAAQGWGAVGDVGPVLGGSVHPKPCTGSCSGQGDVRAVGFVQHVLVSPDLTPRSWRVEVTVLAPLLAGAAEPSSIPVFVCLSVFSLPRSFLLGMTCPSLFFSLSF